MKTLWDELCQLILSTLVFLVIAAGFIYGVLFSVKDKSDSEY